MNYSGMKTDIDYGDKIVDNYGMLTHNRLRTILTHGNLLISAKTFNEVLRTIARKKYKRYVKQIFRENPETMSVKKRELYDQCIREAMDECARRTGYSKCTWRILEKDSDSDNLCIIIERADGGRIGNQ